VAGTRGRLGFGPGAAAPGAAALLQALCAQHATLGPACAQGSVHSPETAAAAGTCSGVCAAAAAAARAAAAGRRRWKRKWVGAPAPVAAWGLGARMEEGQGS